MGAFRVPIATYRIQFSLGFRYVDGRDLVPYLNELGITDLYSSPRFKARRGSSHAYDVANPLKINSELGTEEEFSDLARKLRSYGMGQLLDIVPNHMVASKENPWWMDVLENGRSSIYAHHFDVDWRRTVNKGVRENKVVLPILGDLYGRVLEHQELVLKLDENGFFVQYYEHRLPINPKTYNLILNVCLEKVPSGPVRRDLERLQGDISRLSELTGTHEETEGRHRDKESIKRDIWKLYLSTPEVRASFDESMRTFDGSRGDPGSFDLLDELLSAQAYRIAFWRMASEELNYRRFFDITDLIGVRVEDPLVFDSRHPEILHLIKSGKVTGFRVDHIDGLYNPHAYLRRLQDQSVPGGDAEGCRNVYVIVEKILGGNEALPCEWAACGTTGYDFLNYLNGLFIHPEGLKALDRIYNEFTGTDLSIEEVRYGRKKQVMDELFAGEVRALADHLGRLAAQDRYARDVSITDLLMALVEVTAWFPVYRTYIHQFAVDERDRQHIEYAISRVERALEGKIHGEAAQFLRRVLLVDVPHYVRDPADWLHFVMRWQQFTGPVMAKGYEDTTCYVFNRLVSQNEVGSDPDSSDEPVQVAGFHERNQARLAHWPYTLNATSTHDTKRSEDVRARLNVLSEIPEEWRERLYCWAEMNKDHKHDVDGAPAPDHNEEVLLYQTLIGAWPLCGEDTPALRDRIKNYMQKALREAKTHTSWLQSNEPYETAVLQFVDAILEDSEQNKFRSDLERFSKRIGPPGAVNALAQTLLKITSPGSPDFYQGTEVWDLSLVDPDNRRPVDFVKRAGLLDQIKRDEAQDAAVLVSRLVQNWEDGRIKLYLTYKSLNFRRDCRDVFTDGEYLPLYAEGTNSNHLCAFARHHGDHWALIAVPLWVAHLNGTESALPFAGLWSQELLDLPAGAPVNWRNVFTRKELTSENGRLGVAQVFGEFPVALLESLPESTKARN